MNISEQDLRDFLGEELFYSLFDISNEIYSQQLGSTQADSDSMFKKTQRSFLYKLHSEEITSEELLKALYAVEFAKEKESLRYSSRRFSSRSLRKRLSNKYAELYCDKMEIDPESEEYESMLTDYTNLFNSLIRDVTQKESIVERFNSNATIHSIHEMFLSSFQRSLDRTRLKPGQKKRVIKLSRQSMRYKDPNKSIKHFLGPTLSAVVLAGSLTALKNDSNRIVSPNEPTPIESTTDATSVSDGTSVLDDIDQETIKSITGAEEQTTPEIVPASSTIDSSKMNPNELRNIDESAIELLYAHPEYIAQLGVPDNFIDDFKQYISQRNLIEKGRTLDDSSQEAYDELRSRLIDELVRKKTCDIIYSSTGKDASELDIEASNAIQAQVFCTIADENYDFTIMNSNDANGLYVNNIRGSHAANAVASSRLYANKRNSNMLMKREPGRIDDLDNGIIHALLYYTRNCSLDLDSKYLTENGPSDKLIEFVEHFNQLENDEPER